MADREMREVDQKAEVRTVRAHIGRKSCRKRCRPDECCLIYVIVKDLKLDIHVFLCSVTADIHRRFEKLCVCFLLRFLAPFSCEEGDAASAKVLRIIHRLNEGSLRLEASCLIKIIGIQLWTKETRLRTIADLQMRGFKDLFQCDTLFLTITALDLDRIKKIVACDLLCCLERIKARETHPTNRTYLEIFMNGFSHGYILLIPSSSTSFCVR